MNIYVAYGKASQNEDAADLPVLAWHGKPADAEVLAAYKRVAPQAFDKKGTFTGTFTVAPILMA